MSERATQFGIEIKRYPLLRTTGRAFMLVLLVVVFAACRSGPGDRPTIALVVRHAEASTSMGRDPDLTVSGHERARALVSVLEHADVAAIFASQFKRTRQTVQPLADTLGLDVEIIAIETGDLRGFAEAFAARVRAEHAGQTIIIANHSNTVPRIVEALSGVEIGPITEREYGDLFIVELMSGETPGRVIRATFGDQARSTGEQSRTSD